MRTKAKYTLSVREQEITITFSKINDSRRLDGYYSHKKPNFFHVKGATLCQAELPNNFGSTWWKEKYKDPYPIRGMGFCHWSDKWDSRKGRHSALREALSNIEDKELRLEIWVAFEAEEKARTKVKGPARQPKTAKPKVRKPRPPAPGGIHEILGRIAVSLELLASQNAPDPGTWSATALVCPSCGCPVDAEGCTKPTCLSRMGRVL